MATRRRSAELSEHSWEHVLAREWGRVFVVLPPWLGWLLILGVAVALRRQWPGASGAAASAAASGFLALLLLHLTHHRKGFGRVFSAATTAAAGLWIGWVQMEGISLHAPQAQAWVVGGGTVALSWSVWLHIHEGGDEAGTSRLFGRATLKAGYEGLKLVAAKAAGGRVSGYVDHPKMTHEEFVKAMPSVEAAWPKGIPPGSFTLTRDEDHAGRTRFVRSNPRNLKAVIPWPGPSVPRGGSIADPVTVGRWQDGTPVSYVAAGYHEQIMAMTGVGKTLGCCYSELGECMTRHDEAIFAADLMKRRQFFGPMDPALHYLATTPEQLRKLLDACNASLGARTDYLGSKYLGNWERACGLTHCCLWIEEAADAFEAIDSGIEDFLFPLIRAARSAGWRIVYSLHRASYEQMPTFLKDMVALTTMGVRNESHARFGLSAEQADAECHPEMWADRKEHRGKFYRDAPSIETQYQTMAGRYFSWGSTTKGMAEHAARYPATERPLDSTTLPFFAELMGQVRTPATAPAAQPARQTVTLTAERPPVTTQEDRDMYGEDEVLPADLEPLRPEELEGGDLPIGQDVDEGPAVPVSREMALETVRRQIQDWRREGGVPSGRGRSAEFGIRDLRPLATQIGKTRTWLYTVMPDLESEREIRREGDHWVILQRAA